MKRFISLFSMVLMVNLGFSQLPQIQVDSIEISCNAQTLNMWVTVDITPDGDFYLEWFNGSTWIEIPSSYQYTNTQGSQLYTYNGPLPDSMAFKYFHHPTLDRYTPLRFNTACGQSVGIEESLDNLKIIGAEYYNLQGQRINEITQPGMYVKVYIYENYFRLAKKFYISI